MAIHQADYLKDLRLIFDYVKWNPWSTVKQISSVIKGGPLRANHFLRKYQGELFVMRRPSHPEWSVVSFDALERILPPEPPDDWVRRTTNTRSSRFLPFIPICGACGSPIQSSGMCGCS